MYWYLENNIEILVQRDTGRMDSTRSEKLAAARKKVRVEHIYGSS